MTQLVSTREIAAMLGVTTETVLRWTRSGRLPAFRIGTNAIRYDLDAIEAWLVECGSGERPGDHDGRVKRLDSRDAGRHPESVRAIDTEG